MTIRDSKGRQVWLDSETDPHNEIGWVVDNPPADVGVESDSLTVAEAIALVPERRDEILSETRDAIKAQREIAADPDSGYPPTHWTEWLEATERLEREMRNVIGGSE